MAAASTLRHRHHHGMQDPSRYTHCAALLPYRYRYCFTARKHVAAAYTLCHEPKNFGRDSRVKDRSATYKAKFSLDTLHSVFVVPRVSVRDNRVYQSTTPMSEYFDSSEFGHWDGDSSSYSTDWEPQYRGPPPCQIFHCPSPMSHVTRALSPEGTSIPQDPRPLSPMSPEELNAPLTTEELDALQDALQSVLDTPLSPDELGALHDGINNILQGLAAPTAPASPVPSRPPSTIMPPPCPTSLPYRERVVFFGENIVQSRPQSPCSTPLTYESRSSTEFATLDVFSRPPSPGPVHPTLVHVPKSPMSGPLLPLQNPSSSKSS
ncbi:hypothetical protein EDB83DRAFT_2517180 [Lactarius deliciosus]|nr:hypothetical protein EDB83DRAFT_2517180 [Lactarius deliciosus]